MTVDPLGRPAQDRLPTVAQALLLARQAGLDLLDAQLLLRHLTGLSRTALITQGEQPLTPEENAAFQSACARRLDGWPVAYLIGSREFHGLTLRVSPDVLDPRPDTETLVDWALECIDASPMASGTALDLGTGSGAIALALRHQRPNWTVHATDASPAALAVARGNAQTLGLAVTFHAGSWWQALPSDLKVDLAVSNPPYIAEGDPHLPALRHEPRTALVAGEDGLADLRALVQGAAPHLQPGGWLLLEHGHEQGPAVARLLAESGFNAVAHREDMAGRTRCTGGRLAG